MKPAKDKTAKSKTDYTMGGKIKIGKTHLPVDRPSYEAWVQSLHTSEFVYMNHPEAKPKADRIMEHVGIVYDCRTWWEIALGKDIEESVNYVPEPVRTN